MDIIFLKKFLPAMAMFVVLAGQAVAEDSMELAVKDAASKVLPSSVAVVISKDARDYTVDYQDVMGIKMPVYRMIEGSSKRLGAGSGFIISQSGYIATNRHVIIDLSADYTILLADGSQRRARVVYGDAYQDLAILKIDGEVFSPVVLGDSDKLEVGQPVVAIGNAFGTRPNTVSWGKVTALNQTVKAFDQKGNSQMLEGIIQTSARIHPGNSGGPLLDLQGNIVGINVAHREGAESISFAIPINAVKNIISMYALQ